ncbi:MAG: hypothetical protein GXP41_09840 [Chloroflexi bacterium]|nr:hypothetical protein [Chloroflexota bacterium]
MQFRYSTTDPTQSELDSLPRLPLVLRQGERIVNAVGLVDSGATVNVLPYQLGIQLGAAWDDQKATIRLAGNLGQVAAQPLFPLAEIADFPPIRLAFAWSRSDDVPLILGQMNFFMEFDVCFYRSQLEFEVKPRSR